MLAINGYSNGESIVALEDIPLKGKVIITFVEEEKPRLLRDELTPEQLVRFEKSVHQLDNGQSIPHEEVMARAKAKKWLIK